MAQTTDTLQQVTIYTTAGVEAPPRFVTPMNEGVTAKFTLGSEDYITLPFSTTTPIAFEPGDWCDLSSLYDTAEGLRGQFAKIYKIVTPPTPTYNTSTGGYDYQLRMDAYYFEWQKKLFVYMPKTGAREVAWSITQSLDVQLDCLLENLETYGFSYNGKPYVYSLDKSSIETAYLNRVGKVTTNAKLLSYNETNLIDALTMMAEAWNCEWWVIEGVIYFGRIENKNAIPLTIENAVDCETMTRSESKGTYATRLYVFGSERNIPQTYRKSLIFAVSETGTSGNRVTIKDGVRPLKSSYFSEDKLSYKDGTIFSLGAAISGTTETVTATKSYKYQTKKTTIPTGIYKLSTTNQYANIIASQGIMTVGYKLSLVINGKPQVLVKGDQYIYSHTTRIVLNVKHEEELAINTDTEAYLELELTPRDETKQTASLAVQYLGQATLTLRNRYPAIATAVTFLTGANQGKTISATVNADYTETGQSTIFLPAGTSVNKGDKFTLSDLDTDKVPRGFWSVAMNTDTYTSGVVQRRLMLPEGINYIDAYRYYNGKRIYIGETDYNRGTEMSAAEAVDAVIKTDEIYPRAQLSVNGVTFYEREQQEDGIGTGRFERFYQVTIAENFTFKEEYRIQDKDLQICFYSGRLNGMVFGCIFHAKGTLNADTRQNYTADTYELVVNEDYGRKLPDTVLNPEPGDKFTIIGWDCTKTLASLITSAEQELYTYGVDALKKMMRDDGVYSCPMMSDKIAADPKTMLLPLGYPVLLKNPSYFGSEGRKSRLIGYEIKLDIPFDTPIYTFGESVQYTRLQKLESKINELTVTGDSYQNASTTVNSSQTSYTPTGTGSAADATITTPIVVTTAVGNYKKGDTIDTGESIEQLLRYMLNGAKAATLTSNITDETSNQPAGGLRPAIIYTAEQNCSGKIVKVVYDGQTIYDATGETEVGSNPFTQNEAGELVAMRTLKGNFGTEMEEYKCTVTFAQEDTMPETTKTTSVKFKPYLRWYAGVCDKIPTTESDIIALPYSGRADTRDYNAMIVKDWRLFSICTPETKPLSSVYGAAEYLQNTPASTRGIGTATVGGIKYKIYYFKSQMTVTESIIKFTITEQ